MLPNLTIQRTDARDAHPRRRLRALGFATTSRVLEVKEALMPSSQETFDVIIIGGGIAGSALAAVLARKGRAVLVLERSTVYRDKVRGEFFHAWGVAEAQ